MNEIAVKLLKYENRCPVVILETKLKVSRIGKPTILKLEPLVKLKNFDNF